MARFSQAEFCGFLTDVLIDARRRQNIASLRPLDQLGTSNLSPNLVQFRKDRESNLSDNEPLYDAVAEDLQDYGQVGIQQVKIARDRWLRNNNSID